MMATEQTSALRELDSCIQRHNQVLRTARGLWEEAQQASQRIGRLVGVALSTGTSWSELGRLLATVDEAGVPAGLRAQSGADCLPTDRKSPGELGQMPERGPVGDPEEAHRVPPQNARADFPPGQPAEELCTRERALQVVRGVSWPSGIEVGTLMRVLAAEGRTVTEPQTRGWLSEWNTQGQVQRVDADRYVHGDLLLDSPTLATGAHAPLLLRRAHQVVAATPEKEMSTRALAAALNENVNIVGGELCSMLREAGIPRPNRGKISARYGGATGPRLPGFTAETLGQAIAVYNGRGASDTQSRRDPSVPVHAPAGEQLRLDASQERLSVAGQEPPKTGRERTLEIVEGAGGSGTTHSTLVRQLDEEKHLVTGSQIRSWLTQWMHEGVIHQLHDGSYVRATTPSAPAGPGSTVPVALVRARDAALEAGGMISSQKLFTVLQHQSPLYRDASHMAGHLVSLLGKVGVQRPDRGQVRIHADQPRVLGFTATTLDQGVSAYKAAATTS
ncbi:hypothetical protein [Streptomyces goshikiensis]|uniref:hypothetical protein n=1 Tax=Streptomyces goshikiensis TaxID=1942 RepID=UPI002AE056C6|nr:hypothetical protein [Streptomyces goshikiensis]